MEQVLAQHDAKKMPPLGDVAAMATKSAALLWAAWHLELPPELQEQALQCLANGQPELRFTCGPSGWCIAFVVVEGEKTRTLATWNSRPVASVAQH